ncbi:MAG: sodium:proton exchanger [Candidatus Muproteobacteria bacterium RIFCSPHIGHO2_01_FULL_65_16]|uniref:Sodium:proton exchanger n=2 Tax=Candidatus Muproteobacteria TaxID=1817795 RepID=A0A1F6TGU5_9PROT|nr:MAG: sodium:proton exchanger [Candidatus Muproteobacteria bacterium RBG_16_65_31]OGI45039.1 MAG: sodium:proton exchanger [Candidatus Muproteobacteria bacterium RIFCSPHIGHO2_01_FULL_65_16]
MTFALLLTALVIILIGAETFTNALEHLGERLKISEGVTGSIFAAVGTALPETMVPVVAILTSAGTQQVREEVGVGAIIGAPLMLSTLTMFLMAAFAAHRRGWADHFHPERDGLRRDLSWFLLAFGVSTAAIFIPHHVTSMRALLAIALVLIYFIYLMLTVRASARLVSDGHGTEADNPLFLTRLLGRFGLRENMPVILAQLAVGLALIILGAHGFVQGVQELSAWLGISALVLSLLIIPVATELPEKVNSILWIRRRRDTLAFGNITGAMVFQGSLLPAIGIMLTPWEPRPEVLAGMILTLLASGYLLAMLRRGGLRPYHLIVNGLCYAAYLITVAI